MAQNMTMHIPEQSILAVVPCPLTMVDFGRLCYKYIEQHNEKGLRIDIRGTFCELGSQIPVMISDWQFLKSWSELFGVVEVLPVTALQENPRPPVHFLRYRGPGELRFRLVCPQEATTISAANKENERAPGDSNAKKSCMEVAQT